MAHISPTAPSAYTDFQPQNAIAPTDASIVGAMAFWGCLTFGQVTVGYIFSQTTYVRILSL